jgi:uncharacterized peroxidase-related enzyme
MTVVPLIDPDTAVGRTRDLFATVQRRLGVIPNMTRAMANSPALLEGYLALSGAMAGGTLSGPVQEQIALAIAQRNGCDYCLSAHSYLAENVAHLDSDTIAAARKADSADPKTAALLAIASAVVDNRGELSTRELNDARAAGVADGEIAEVIGNVALQILTNYFNKAVGTDVDFPLVTA